MKFLKLLSTAILFIAFSHSQSFSQTVTVTAPNGGEVLYACQTYTVTWNQTGSPSNYWTIDYSLDGGTIWTSVTSNYLSTNGQFSWTVPNIQSTTVLMRVKDSQNPLTVDQSNAVFTINIPIILTSPNGGEIWQGNTIHNITWNAIGTSNTYNIAYSINNGSSWTNIVTNYSTGSGTYAWTVPTLALNVNCLVRVQDYTTNCMQDISNAVFTITPATPILLTPNVSQTLQVFCSYEITWNTSTLYTSVKLDYSTDNGTTWINIVNGTTNDGSYYWNVPNSPSTTCLVRISNYNDMSVVDVSNATFTIAQPVTITAPNGGENFIGCNSHAITWSKTTCAGNWTISYSTDNGVSYTTITTVGDNGLSSQTYNWTVPNGITSTQTLIKVVASSYPTTITDVSNAVFNINPSNDITVTSPNGGENWQGLSTKTITWTNLPSASGQYTLQYSTNGGSNWSTIISNITGNSYNWTVPNLSSTTCLVKVIDYNNTCKFDNSNANFTISPAVPVLLTPNTSQTLQAYCSYEITWNTATLYTSVRLDYSTDNGSTWTSIVNGTTNDGSHYWTVPNIPSTTCLVRLSNYNDLSVVDVSNTTFTIAQPVTITAPNGGENFIGCNSHAITWSKTTCAGNWTISYSTDNGVTYTTITTVGDNGLSSQTYNWTVPNGITSAQSFIKVVASSYPTTITDISNAVFNINPSNDITVTSPNGGQNWQGLSTQTITWTNLPSASGQYTLQYSTNGGSNWSTIVSNITGNSYNWTVPNLSSTTCLVKVIDYNNTCKFDNSNSNFTISPAVPILLTPNTSQTLQVYCSYEITWNTATLYTSVRLDYSTDNGTTWTSIVNGTTNDGSHYWTVPNIPSTTCLVRISNYNDLSVVDVSNTTFTIAQPVTITAPNGSENFIGCNSHAITWSKTTCAGNWTISYSTNNGGSYTTITTVGDNGLSSQTYNWTVPNGITSSQALIQIVASTYPTTITDVSNAAFNINLSNDITVTSPNGGENWQGLSTHAITWTNLPSASGQYTLQYSTNGGSNWSTIVSNITGNSYNWTVPNLSSTTCLIKVIDYNNTCKFDNSNANFTISPAVPVLLTPNTTQTLQVYCSYEITWNTATLYTSVRLDYSTDNGTTWTNIVNGTTNDGSHYWTIPNIPSTTCLVRLSNYNDLSVSDISNSTFTIAQPVTITAPNGGDNFIGCSSHAITWSKTACAGNWTISYSTDNGVTYNTITTVGDNGLSSQTYNWTVPNGITTTQALIQIVASTYPTTINDVSNAVFNINPSNDITVTSPNGGENWQGLSSKTITWTNLPSASGQYTLQYSTNGGSNWSTIVSNVSGNTYNWTVPNLSSTTCLVKVIDYNNTCKFDNSNANFTISPAVPVLLTPNVSQTMQAYCSYEITWNTTTLYTSVRLDYSTDNGTTWINIVNGTTNDGSHYWTVPNIPSTTCLVRISNYNDLSVWDISNAPFIIDQPVTITAPNGGDNYIGCSTHPITWTKSTCVGNWTLSYSTDNGVTYTTITTVGDNGLSSQTYNWIVPNGITSTQCFIKVVASTYPTTITDVSNAAFNINPSNDITVTSPNGGENWQGLSTKTITWTNLPSASGQYTLQYSINGGSNWTTIVSNIIGNAHNWTVPNLSSTTCLIKVIDYMNTCKFDISNANFTISPAAPILITPNGGEVLYSGTSFEITWNTATLYTSVRLDYSLDNGTTWTNIVNGTTNDGSHYWTIPNASSTTCLVRISNYNDLSIVDVSNAVFTIKPAVTVITPNGSNGSTIWGGCTVTSITFDRSSAWNNYKIEYSINNGVNWILITSSWTTSANPATYNWSIPNTPSTQTLVRVTPNSVPSYYDQSDNVFTITKPVTIIQPNFGGIMQVGSVYNISWSSDGISNIYDIFYSINGGSSYTNIITAYNTSLNTYAWTVPNNPSTNCKIVVRDNINNCKSDTSDVVFTITPTAPPITLVTPNGGQNLSGCHSYNITWTDSPSIGTYDISYSTNSGSTWNTIVNGYVTASQSYTWAIPNTINSSTVLVRVASTSTPTTYDQSDALLSINYGKIIALPSDTTICQGNSFQITSTGGYNYSWTPTAGLSSSSIANPIATPSTTTQYIVESNNAGCILKDTVNVTVLNSSLSAGVSIVASPSNTICNGTSVTFTATPSNGGVSPSYQWKVNGGNVGTNAPTYTSSSLTNGQSVTCVMTSSSVCVSGNPATSNAIVMSVSPIVTPSVTVSANPGNTICGGTNVTFTATPTNGGASPTYQWKLNTNNVGTNSTTYSNNTLNNGDVITVELTSNQACVTTPTATAANTTMNVTTIPTQPGTITGNSSICANSSNTYSVSAVSGATSYTWTLPSGWSGTSTTNSISTTAGTTGGTITVTANNTCGNSTAQSLVITVNTTPAQPGTISGNNPICDGTSNTYSISPVSGATSYTWTTPSGWSGTSTSSALTTTASTTSGNITVTADNVCGSSTAQTLAITVNTVPVQPGTISGNTTVCDGSSNTYSITSVPTATSYTWTLPGGWSGTSTTNSITTTAGTTGGTITVVANNACGGSTSQSVTVNVITIPALPGTITGSTSICENTSNTYSIAAVAGATSYTWTLPGGWSGTSTTNSITTTSSATSGLVSVTANNTCGNSPAQGITITVNPAPAITASGTNTICSGDSTSLSVNGAASYSWLPAASLTNSAIANPDAFPATTTTYTVTGTSNGCSSIDSVTITVNQSPVVTMSGNTNLCIGDSTSLTAGGANSYAWLPITGLNNPAIANPKASPAATTTYTVTGTSGTCVGTTTVTINVNPIPTVTASGDTTLCSGQSTNLLATCSGTPTYSWLPATGLNNVNIANPVATPATTTTYTVTGTSLGCSDTDTVTIVVNPTPLANAGNDTSICISASVTLNASGGTSYSWSPATGLNNLTIANPIATPTVTTTYTVTVGNGTGCTSTASVTVAVNALPNANAGTNVSIPCGGSTNLSGSGGATFSWSPTTGLNNPNSANPMATPNYSITYTLTASNGGCSDTASVTVTVGNMTASAGNDTAICDGGNVLLNATSTGGTSGTWVNVASSYSFAQAVGTYTPITGGTVWLNSSSASMDDEISSVIPIPTFKYNNINYTSLRISTNGFVTFGSTIPNSTEYLPISSTTAYSGAISGMGVDINKATTGTPEISYKQVGNEFVIQWKDVSRYNVTGERFSFQIRLNTLNNEIKTVYTTAAVGTDPDYPQVGLRGPSNTFSTDVNNRRITSGTWVNTTAGISNASTCTFASTTIPSNGTTFTWTPVNASSTTYTWAPPTGLSCTTCQSTTASPTVTTTYTVTATSGACSAIDVVTVTVNPLPTVTHAPLSIICLYANSITLTGGTPSGGTYSGPGVTGGIFNPTAAGLGIHNLVYTYSNGTCSDTAMTSILVDICTGVAANENGNVTVYPNPFSDFTTIAIDPTVQLVNTEVHIYDALGKEVMVLSNINKHSITIPRRDLRDGMYFFRIMNNAKEMNRGKLIIQ